MYTNLRSAITVICWALNLGTFLLQTRFNFFFLKLPCLIRLKGNKPLYLGPNRWSRINEARPWLIWSSVKLPLYQRPNRWCRLLNEVRNARTNQCEQSNRFIGSTEHQVCIRSPLNRHQCQPSIFIIFVHIWRIPPITWTVWWFKWN